MAKSIQEGIEYIIDYSRLWLDRLKEVIRELYPDYQGNLLKESNKYLEKLKKQYIITDVCTIVSKLCKDLIV